MTTSPLQLTRLILNIRSFNWIWWSMSLTWSILSDLKSPPEISSTVRRCFWLSEKHAFAIIVNALSSILIPGRYFHRKSNKKKTKKKLKRLMTTTEDGIRKCLINKICILPRRYKVKKILRSNKIKQFENKHPKWLLEWSLEKCFEMFSFCWLICIPFAPFVIHTWRKSQKSIHQFILRNQT